MTASGREDTLTNALQHSASTAIKKMARLTKKKKI